jgi:hypothetical protein
MYVRTPATQMRLASYRSVDTTDARQPVRNVIQALRAMPPDARAREIESGRYSNLSPDEQDLVRQAAGIATAAAVGAVN